ncbi:hypothetical protein ACFLTE_05000 [Bacteroidota bacterium]
MEEKRKSTRNKYQIEYKRAVVKTAVFKLTESSISKSTLEVFLELSQMLKQIIKIEEQAICGFLIIAYELMEKTGVSIDFDKYNEVDLLADDSIKELITFFKRVIVLALVNRIDIFQINENIDELLYDTSSIDSDILNN